jgi:hypothetical protein
VAECGNRGRAGVIVKQAYWHCKGVRLAKIKMFGILLSFSFQRRDLLGTSVHLLPFLIGFSDRRHACIMKHVLQAWMARDPQRLAGLTSQLAALCSAWRYQAALSGMQLNYATDMAVMQAALKRLLAAQQQQTQQAALSGGSRAGARQRRCVLVVCLRL